MAGSELAAPNRRQRTGWQARTGPVYGLCWHTTGSGIVEQALTRGRDPLEHAVAYYLGAEFYAHYVIGWDGTIVQIVDELARAPHVGYGERALYLSGEWAQACPRACVAAWRAAWPAFESPAHLMPNASSDAPNNLYVGAEMLPLPTGARASTAPAPAFRGSSFTLPQHQAVTMLALDVADRHDFPSGWPRGPRLAGHEDLNPLKRSDSGGGWDPGALRPRPRFDARWVRALCSGEEPGPIGPSSPAGA